MNSDKVQVVHESTFELAAISNGCSEKDWNTFLLELDHIIAQYPTIMTSTSLKVSNTPVRTVAFNGCCRGDSIFEDEHS